MADHTDEPRLTSQDMAAFLRGRLEKQRDLPVVVNVNGRHVAVSDVYLDIAHSTFVIELQEGDQ